MKLISWNVNGIRACKEKGFNKYFNDEDADIFCIQETKMQEGQADMEIPGYYRYMSSAVKKGYSGTCVYSKLKPLSVVYGINGSLYNDEGRIITLEFEGFYLVNAYVPNAQEELKRLGYRMEYEDNLRNYLVKLDEDKPVIYCGDLNVAHTPMDLKNPQANVRNAGFSIEERTKFTALLASGFVDSFRYMYPNVIKYSWWSYRFNSRANNTGWRIDYFLTSDRIKNKIIDSQIDSDIYGSDHCPVKLLIDL